ncbi:hypothetical protein BASA50_003384 [Batrachochytrium salamandrivorans]|uniref:Cation-transporting ATPase n=1 Tax=Batrachochytrium salamandrivorans TaxID=1357716 RepID=A0ABQ8FIK0_9FUNG|nr:hypothetical protein BASA60_008245 [Batrachochytrium salamandrivorans]KAH6572302.1 hypothetical protein BASA62_003451 [Batrachochytrium salamandrivorans]KAH6598877.1 hypothetical protein BASA50_003384 [Batrachochytrium salamandrivorans]KAJ1339056.1 hypothetical protein BSLG_006195 [Batrachochytrium salamandrivorans]
MASRAIKTTATTKEATGAAKPMSATRTTGAAGTTGTTATFTKFSQTLVAAKVVRISQLVSPSPHATRIYSYPFGLVYAAWGYLRLFYYEEVFGMPEFALFSFLIVVALHALSYLVCLWSVQARVALTCCKETDINKATAIMILPIPDSGVGDLCDLKHSEITNLDQSKEIQTYFLYQQKKYVFNKDKKRFEKLDYLSSYEYDMLFYKKHRGMKSDQQVVVTSEKYGGNRFEVPIPSFQELFKEHVVAPFFVFQLFCVALWFLDEMWYFSLFTLSMLFIFESTVVFQRLRNLQEFRSMSIKPYPINVYRSGKWSEIYTDELLPGDMCSVSRQKDDIPVPADMILVGGSCIANEAMLSGESTPQLKEPISLRDDHEIFDVNEDKNHILFGGTKILQVTAPEDVSEIQTPDKGCLAIVLRTGFATQQGKLVRTIVYSTERVSANNMESLFFIIFLLFFAIIASWYVWTTGSMEEDRNQSKLLLHCVLIITSVVPPELPMELSLAVNNSLVSLAKAYVFCTEPFRIPFAGRIDVACFDKTGTLTAENLIVEGVTGLKGPMDDLALPTMLPIATTHALAAAHALVRLEDGIIGDPMEKNTLESINCTLIDGDIIVPKPDAFSSSAKFSIRVQRRFPFSSSLKRMSTVSILEDRSASPRTLIAAKGAPETIKGMLKNLPKDYDEHYKYWARRGKRVLAFAYKHAPHMSVSQIRDLSRDETEKDLIFAGFLIFYCPLKPDSAAAIRILNESLHRVVMITGDNALTASHIAREVEIVRRKVLIADVNLSGDLVWQTVDEKVSIVIDCDDAQIDSRLVKYDLGCTGAGLDAIVNTPCFGALLPRLWVYARVSPSQKELILTRLKQAGYFTLMCGDGTNDVGALKQAHVGIALLDTTPEDLQKIGMRMREKNKKAMMEKQNAMLKSWGLPPVAEPPASNAAVTGQAQQAITNSSTPVATSSTVAKPKKMDTSANMAPLSNMMDKMMEEMDDDIPKIKFGDASVAAPFTSKISSVMSVVNIVRQGRATLVAMVQMYKILGLNSLIMAYSLSVLHLAGIKQGDWQATIAGFMITICFFGIAKSEALEKLSRQRPQPNIFNLYIVLSVLGQAAVHVAALIYIRLEAIKYSEELEEDVALDAEFAPNLLNSAVYLVSLIMQISTFAINYQGLPFRESLVKNKAMFNSLVVVGAIAFAAAFEFSDELNGWMQLVPFPDEFRTKLLLTMALDYGIAWCIEMTCSFLFSDNRAKASLFPLD